MFDVIYWCSTSLSNLCGSFPDDETGDFITPYGTYEIINLVIENSTLENMRNYKKDGSGQWLKMPEILHTHKPKH